MVLERERKRLEGRLEGSKKDKESHSPRSNISFLQSEKEQCKLRLKTCPGNKKAKILLPLAHYFLLPNALTFLTKPPRLC
jgi:hypothetical protein